MSSPSLQCDDGGKGGSQPRKHNSERCREESTRRARQGRVGNYLMDSITRVRWLHRNRPRPFIRKRHPCRRRHCTHTRRPGVQLGRVGDLTRLSARPDLCVGSGVVWVGAVCPLHLPHRGSASSSGQGCSCPASRLSDALLAAPRSSSVERRNAQPVHTFSPKPPPPPAPSSNSEPALVIRLSSSDAATRRRHQTKNTGARGVTCRRVGPPRTPPSQRGMRKAADHGWHASTPFGHPPCPPCPQR